ncbi:MAG: hypothetical protein IV100_22580 [Myxococcales bacterium]|nr:hypothetical protein [Myxococcales bacterium]
MAKLGRHDVNAFSSNQSPLIGVQLEARERDDTANGVEAKRDRTCSLGDAHQLRDVVGHGGDSSRQPLTMREAATSDARKKTHRQWCR